jgi:5-methyltetrahydropteroyltriglutamate--homocysteine methyltransferase
MRLAYRADQVGSLLRPTELLEARAARAQGRLAPDALRKIEDQAILDALELQRRVGLDVYMDGEFRRTGWMTDLIASNALGDTLTPDDQRRKLELVAKVARRVWDDR